MKVLLLSAGYGKRLRPLTNDIPKPLLTINGKPLLEIWIEMLLKFNFGPLFINYHYLPERFKSFFNNTVYKEKINLLYENELLGTAGTLINNINTFIEDDDEDILMLHSDNYCTIDFDLFHKAHKERPKKCLLTMLVFRTNTPETCGVVKVDKDKVVYDFYEKKNNPPSNLANAAIYILSKEFLRILKNDFYNVSDFSNDVIPNFMDRIYTYEISSKVIDIGTIENYNLANNMQKI